jgi:spermidine synthase
MTDSGAHRLFWLAFLTGLAGLGSETVFFKLFDFTLGSAPLVAFAVVAVFILGMGIGAQLSFRIARPWIAEAAVAVYDLLWILLFDPLRAMFGAAVASLSPALGINLTAAILCATAALPAAVLLGISFPAIAEQRGRVAHPYLWNTLGAASGVILVDAVLYPYLGLSACLAFLAAAHALAALLLYGRSFNLERLARAPLVPLLIATGAATGAFQGVWLFLSQLLFQPFYFVQPVVVTSMLVGLSFGSGLWLRFRFSFARVLLWVLAGAAASAIGVALVLRSAQAESVPAAIGTLSLLILPAAIPIGALLPAFFGEKAVSRSEVGAGWLSIALGNAIGLVWAGALLLPVMSPLYALLVIAVMLLALAVRSEPWSFVPVVALGGAALFASDALYIQRIPEHHDRAIAVHHLFRGPGELSAIYSYVSPRTNKNQRRLYQTGYSPMYLDESPEAVIGAVGAAYAKRAERVLILGAGSGYSAGAMARVFARCDVVDIGNTVPDLLRVLGPENGRLLERKNVRYFPIDAVLAPYALEPGYDLIVLTVDPAYHARAAKLYTKEVLEDFRRLLAPDGVFVFWADAELDAEASQVLINTGRAVFAQQKLYSAFPLSRGTGLSYYFLVHSQTELRYDPGRIHARNALAEDAAVRALPEFYQFNEREADRLIRGRAHDTSAVHSLFRPARSLLFGGYHQGAVSMKEVPSS